MIKERRYVKGVKSLDVKIKMKLPLIKESVSSADEIYNAVIDVCEFYIDENREAFFVIPENNSYKLCYLSNADASKLAFLRVAFDAFNCTVRATDVSTAYDLIRANVEDIKNSYNVFTRVGKYKDSLYYDLADSSGQVVKITKTSVKLVKKSDIKNVFFYQDKTMREQVVPCESNYGVLDFLEEFFNLSEEQKILLATYIYSAFVAGISHPILIVEGEKGSGKTTLLNFLSKIINPVSKDVLVLPRNSDSLITTLSNNHFAAFDNIGKLSDEFSNIFCQASTGGTLIKRKLYTDNTEIAISIKRLVALNGINLEISQADLLDRAVIIALMRIDDSKRVPDTVIMKRFQEVLPYILGDIFCTLSKALKILQNLNLDKYPRMADFAKHGYAIAEAVKNGYGEVFNKAYSENITLATTTAVEENPLLDSVRQLVDDTSEWTGTSTELRTKLLYYLSKSGNRNVPSCLNKAANALTRELNAHSHEFKALGIAYESGRGKARYITIKKLSSEIATEPTVTTVEEKKVKINSKIDELLQNDDEEN